MQAFLLITGYLVNIRKTYKEFVSYIMKILIPYIIMVTGYAFVSTLLPVRDGAFVKDVIQRTAQYRLYFQDLVSAVYQVIDCVDNG